MYNNFLKSENEFNINSNEEFQTNKANQLYELIENIHLLRIDCALLQRVVEKQICTKGICKRYSLTDNSKDMLICFNKGYMLAGGKHQSQSTKMSKFAWKQWMNSYKFYNCTKKSKIFVNKNTDIGTNQIRQLFAFKKETKTISTNKTLSSSLTDDENIDAMVETEIQSKNEDHNNKFKNNINLLNKMLSDNRENKQSLKKLNLSDQHFLALTFTDSSYIENQQPLTENNYSVSINDNLEKNDLLNTNRRSSLKKNLSSNSLSQNKNLDNEMIKNQQTNKTLMPMFSQYSHSDLNNYFEIDETINDENANKKTFKIQKSESFINNEATNNFNISSKNQDSFKTILKTEKYKTIIRPKLLQTKNSLMMAKMYKENNAISSSKFERSKYKTTYHNSPGYAFKYRLFPTSFTKNIPSPSSSLQHTNQKNTKLFKMPTSSKKSGNILRYTNQKQKTSRCLNYTIPQPFNFTLRKTIGCHYAKKFLQQMLDEKQEKEENDRKEQQKKFKAHIVPITTYVPNNTVYIGSLKRSQSVEPRKNKAINDYTRDKQFKNFYHTPIPASTYLTPSKSMNDIKAKNSRHERALEMLRSASAPRGLLKHSTMWRYQNQTRHGKRCYSAFSNYSADQIRKVKSVPDFRLLHWKLQDQLDKNSAKFKPITTTTPFKFEKNLPQHYCWNWTKRAATTYRNRQTNKKS